MRYLRKNPQAFPKKIPKQLEKAGLLEREQGKVKKFSTGSTRPRPTGRCRKTSSSEPGTGIMNAVTKFLSRRRVYLPSGGVLLVALVVGALFWFQPRFLLRELAEQQSRGPLLCGNGPEGPGADDR